MICFHGTNAEAAKSIERTGFRKGTYFAFDKGAAIKFGGSYIFSVEFSEDPKHWRGSPIEEGEKWQFWLRDPIGPEMIRGLETP